MGFDSRAGMAPRSSSIGSHCSFQSPGTAYENVKNRSCAGCSRYLPGGDGRPFVADGCVDSWGSFIIAASSRVAVGAA